MVEDVEKPRADMEGWVKMEVNDVGKGPESAVVYKERWFELYGRVLVHFAERNEVGEAGYPGDMIHLDDAAGDPGLTMKIVVGKRAITLHTDAPSAWVVGIANAKGVGEVFSPAPGKAGGRKKVLETTTNLRHCSKEHVLADLTFDPNTKTTHCSFGSIRKSTLSEYPHPVAARLIITKYITSDIPTLNNTISTSNGSPFVNTILFQTSTENRMKVVQGWIVSEWIPHPLEGNIGEDRARHQAAQLAVAISYLESINMRDTGCFHPRKIRMTEDGWVTVTGVGLKTEWTAMRRLDRTIEMYHRRPTTVTPSSNPDWWGFAGVLYYLVSGSHPRWATTNPDHQPRLVLPMVSAACCEVLESLLSDPSRTSECTLETIKQFQFFSGLPWDDIAAKSGHVPPPKTPSPAFQVVDLEPPESSMSSEAGSAGLIEESPAVRYRTSDGVLPMPPRAASLGRVEKVVKRTASKGREGVMRGTLASEGRKVESVRKKIALRNREVLGRQPPMRYASPVWRRPVNMAEKVVKEGQPSPPRHRQTLQHRPRDCAVDLLTSTHPANQLHTIKQLEPTISTARPHTPRLRRGASPPRPSRTPPRADYARLPLKDLPNPRKPSGYLSTTGDIKSPPRHSNV